MRTTLALLISLSLGAVAGSTALRPPAGLPGTFVLWDRMDECRALPRRPAPESVWDVRPDDFRTVVALGDSISAGLLARDGTEPRSRRGSQEMFSSPAPLALVALEHRGVAYPSGLDAGALTLPALLSHYANVSGASAGAHPVLGCPGPVCIHPDDDGLNAAVSGATSGRLLAEARECAFCLSSNTSLGPGTPEEFAGGIRDAVEHLRGRVPRMVVNIIGLFRVSALYKLTLTDPYCSGPLRPVPHLPLECSCALLPGPAGDYTRARMDDLGDAYDAAVLTLVRAWNAERDPHFGVVWQPGQFVDLANWPIEALSSVDCFHPSEAAHRRVAAGLWNRMTLGMEDRAAPIRWQDEIRVRCLEEGDRIRFDDFV
ncbi:hypothetical protein Q5752_006218 [Cryptotrichosporon argae]